MEKVIAPNRKMGRMMAKNLIILLTVAIIAFIGIWAWFSNNTTATASGLNVKCQAPDGVEIAVVEHGADEPANDKYSTGLIELTKENYPFLAKLALSEVTSDGITFYKPLLTQTNGVAHPDTTSDWSNAESNVHYLSFDLYIRSKSEFNIYMDSTSKISPKSTVLYGLDAGNKSDYGSAGTSGGISRDCIVGAARFSIVYSSNVRKLLWIPAPNILLTSNNTDTSLDTVETDKTSGDSYVHTYYDSNYKDGKKSIINSGADFVASNKLNYQLNTKKQITTLAKTDTESEYYTSMVTCNLWIEGEDAEARLALVNGQFLANLVLTKNDPAN